MGRRIATVLAAIAVMTHCLIGCCVRCANACDCIAAEDCSASHSTCFHCRWAEACCDLACQPETNEPHSACCLDCDDQSPEHPGHDIGCRKQKCVYIVSKSSLQDLVGQNHFVLFVLPWDGSLLADSFNFQPFAFWRTSSLGFLCQGNLRAHLVYAVLLL